MKCMRFQGGFFKASSKDLDSHGAIATESRS
jgi:hypothetical protein